MLLIHGVFMGAYLCQLEEKKSSCNYEILSPNLKITGGYLRNTSTTKHLTIMTQYLLIMTLVFYNYMSQIPYQFYL